MLTVANVNNEIQEVTDSVKKSHEQKDKKELAAFKKAQKRVKYLRLIRTYLETSPSSEFVKSEIYRLETLITAIMARFSMESIKDEYSKKLAKKKHEKDNEIPKYREQIRNLRFILKG